MTTPVVPKAAIVGKVDRSYARIDPAWLNGETIVLATVVTDNPFIAIGAIDITANEIGFMRTGVTAGTATIHISFTTSGGRGDCKKIRLIVSEC